MNKKKIKKIIKEAINVTDNSKEYFIGMRNGMRFCLYLIDGKEPKYEQVSTLEDKNIKMM